jgi:hypothetical protein
MYLQKVMSRQKLEKIDSSWRLEGLGRSRIRIRIHWSEARIRGSGSVPYQNVTEQHSSLVFCMQSVKSMSVLEKGLVSLLSSPFNILSFFSAAWQQEVAGPPDF